MTHDDLVKHAERWLVKSKGCPFVLTELVTASGETPDAIGWKNALAILVECKATRADFLSDAKKRFRRDPESGMGAYRFYLCPHGLIKPEELPDKWGLVYVWKNGGRKQIKGPPGNTFSPREDNEFYFPERREYGETLMLISALRRVHLRGDLQKIYISPFDPNGNVCFNRDCRYNSRRHTWCYFEDPNSIQVCPARITTGG